MPGVRQLVHRHLLLPTFDTVWKRRKTFKYLAELERSQFLSRAELDSIQLGGLKRLLEHAAAHCEYYRDAWRERGLDPRRVDSLDEFQRWPVIDRDDIRAHRERMRADVPGMRLIAKATGGSTGVPLQFDLNPDSNDRRTASSMRGYGWAGVQPGCKQLYLWGVAVHEQTAKARWKEALYQGMHRRKFLSTFNLTEERFDEYLRVHNRYRPDALVAYTNSLYEFARMLDQKGAKPFSPKSIVVGAEKLHPFQRELIERVFQAPVFETYGSREFMLMGAECDRHQGMHLSQEYLLVEVLDDDGTATAPGEEGNVVVTDLYNYGMPFVRYKNGDRAIAGWGECPCGRGLPLLKQVTGRVVDFVQSPDGRRITGLFFPHLLKDFAGVKRFQVVQDAPDHVQLRVVAAPSWSDGERQAVDKIVRSHLGPRVNLDIVKVEEIPLTATGKQRVVVNACA